MQIKKVLNLVMAMIMVTGVSTAIAQEKQENDGLAQVVKITARDGKAKALEEAITSYHHYMGDKQGAWHWQWYSITTGPDTGSYMARSGNHNWGDFDARDGDHDWQEAAGAKFAAEVQPHIADADVSITRTDKQLGIWPQDMTGYQYFSLTNWQIQPGQGKAFNEGLKKIDKILKDSDWPGNYAFVYTVSGGPGDTITLVSTNKSFADMAPKDPKFIDVMNKAMGEKEAAAFLADWSQTYRAGNHTMLRYRPELSDYGQGEADES